MTTEALVPVEGCWVRRRGTRDPIGPVRERRRVRGRWELKVQWGVGADIWVDGAEVESAFQPGWAVQDIPLSATRAPLGPGRIVGRRTLGGRDQMLVQLDHDGRSVWLPYENLRRIKDARLRYARAETGIPDHAERFRLRLLAHALESWNNLTGSLDRLDVDPLPHQIQLVHRILTSGHFNWLIADDVGLGKTIEVGLLLAALKRRGMARRVLVVAPAGLTRQWQDELRFKFDQTYEIYGPDFVINRPEHWKLHDHVVVSIDLAKREEHLAVFLQSGEWDVVVFDEGHKLTRYADGERAQRYRLAEALRPRSDAFLLLSGTPHQGYQDRFVSLLELVRPDLKREVRALATNPEIVGEMILRNRKSEVTDADGNFIFKGHKVHRVPVDPSPETERFQAHLQNYLRRGYKAGEIGGNQGRAIGFVMTTYRKLASSSIAAIERALRLRLERLTKGEGNAAKAAASDDLAMSDLMEGGDEQDDLVATSATTRAEEFFAYEHDLLNKLIDVAGEVRRNDEKLRIFMEQVVDTLARDDKKLLVFTEYRATQDYLQDALTRRFGAAGSVVLINGSMNLDEKLTAIREFNEGQARFLISTEAGGEGINLQQACHVMVNYDLPWNPARLVQRIGRLYRYGQKLPVRVFNLHARDGFDNKAVDLMLQRVTQIAEDMARVGPEFNERLYADIVGELLDNVDLATVLQSSADLEIERTRDQIAEAVERARRARQIQDDIFSHVSGYDPNALRGTLGFTMQHVGRFIEGMLPAIGVSLVAVQHGSGIMDIRLPDELRGKFGEFGNRTAVRVTIDRRQAGKKDVVLLDFETSFFRYLIEFAKSQAFDGIYASIAAPVGRAGMLAAFKLRWQNDQGEVLMDEFVPLFAPAEGEIQTEPAFLAEMLVSRLAGAPVPNAERGERDRLFGRLVDAADRRLREESSRFKHPNGLVYVAAADCRSGGD